MIVELQATIMLTLQRLTEQHLACLRDEWDKRFAQIELEPIRFTTAFVIRMTDSRIMRFTEECTQHILSPWAHYTPCGETRINSVFGQLANALAISATDA
ncbi:hypothetical protein K5Q02_20785 [Pseudomonas sp. MM211]|uniref:hypothetical protein n=1 Tax=Pseudomonas sp. MM211 TaxID=2866808 RepID=UPI001CEC8019|nr:hypothetical protein [Pseudomonas sp. MM211]UCJ16216.1 hypothetical protein K5Q02_20785 [Pseudomonas sp. MM211]